jgi:DNA polymerase I
VNIDPKKLDPKKTLYLVDGSSFLYRAYYGLRPMHTPQGAPVQAVYGFCRMIKKLIDTFTPEYCALVWDSPGKTTRHETFEAYKATRQAPPSDLFEQKELITEFADAIGLRQVKQSGIEADDLMYSLAKEARDRGETVVFVTSDKDMGQALDAHTFIYDTFKDIFLDVPGFEEKMGFSVEKLPFYFALVGDSSDNIPGVRGIGEKGATELVTQFASLEDLYENIDKVSKPRMRNALEENKKDAFLSRDLFLLQYHASKLSRDDLAFNADDWQKARKIFEDLNFKSLLKDMGEVKIEGKPLHEMYTFKTVSTQKDLDELCVALKKSKIFALDTEGKDLKPLQGTMVGMSFCVQEGTAYYVPFGHAAPQAQLSILSQGPARMEGQLTREQVFKALKPILEDAAYEKVLQNAKFDMHVLHHEGIELRGVTFDTMIAAYLLNKDDQRVGLKDLSLRYFGEKMLSFDIVVKDNKYKDFSQVPLRLATDYAAADAHQTLKLYNVMSPMLESERDLTMQFHELEMPLLQVLVEMEKKGIILDAEVLKELDVRVSRRLIEIEDEIIQAVGPERAGINLNSPRQIEALLFEHLKLPTQKKSAKGTSYSTDHEVLLALSEMHIVPALIVQHRELSKLKSTYIDALPTYINPATKRIHTTFRQTGVATGRLASSDPNLQNIPADVSGFGIEVRGAFIPQPGSVFLSADYSQIELRVLAYFSKDPALVNAFLKGSDIHAETASRLFEVPLDQVAHDQRQIGKRINFSILYGLTPYGLSKDLGIPFKDAKIYIDKYFAQYPGVSVWMESVIEETKKHGYVQTLWGRRRYIPAIYEKNRTLYEEARRVAINTKAQGTAAEIMKLGMLALDMKFAEKNLKSYMLLQIHDELLISVPEKEREMVEPMVKEALESVVNQWSAVKWDVPLVVTTRFGVNWKDVTK